MIIGISRIEVEGFRGITRACVLPLEGKSLLLFGENGTGKSSFVDALERLFTGEVSILEGRMGVSTERHGPNIRAIGRPRICVRFTDGSEYTLEGNAELLTPRARSYLAPAQEPLYILRRRQILEFIESRPQERYDQLRPFLQLKEAEEREAALRTASQRAAQKSGDAQRILKASSRDLAESVGIHEYQVPLSEQHICASISDKLQQTIGTLAPMLSQISGVPDVISAVDSELSRFGDTQMVMAVHTVLSRLRDLDSALRPVDLASFHSVLEGLRQREARIARTFFEDVLQRGLEWIEADWQGMCPLCETPWEKDELTVRIHARLNDMREIVRSRQEADRLRRDLLNSVRKAVDSARLARTDIEALGDEDDLRLTDSLLESLGHHRNLLERRLDQITLEALNVAIDSWQIASYGTRLEETIERINRQAARLPSTSELRPFIELRTILGRVTELWMKQGAALRQRDLTHRRAEIAATMLRLAEEARREEVQELFDAISEDINALYVRLHPDEDHGNIHLEVREEVRASVNVRAKFFDRMNEDPWGYYSDAHLDSLGLCAFLALRRWYRRRCGLCL